MRTILAVPIFFVVANPFTYSLTSKLFPMITDSQGKPTQVGVLIHSFVFLLLMFLGGLALRPRV